MRWQQQILFGALKLSLVINATAERAQECLGQSQIAGIVLDPDGAAVPGALVQVDNGQKTTESAKGEFVLSCVSPTVRKVRATAPGFQETTSAVHLRAAETTRVSIKLALLTVQSEITVNGEDPLSLASDRGIGTHTLTAREIRGLSDDPDDLMRELQVLAAANGGAPGQARVTVDGFQSSSALPPKASIARVVTPPDLFSAEYDTPPYSGGRIEIYTKPGADRVHGALFFTDSEGPFNARDPLSNVATPAGKRRYGVELGGPIMKSRTDYFISLERRQISEFNITDATTLNADGSPSVLQQTVSAPRELWIGSARADLQLTSSDTLALSFDLSSNRLSNQGIGGLVTPEAGFNSRVSQYNFRAVNTQTITPFLLHESRAAWTWTDNQQTPLSIAPNVNVAGYFTGGGNTAQYLNRRERDLEVDDDLIYSHQKHTLKFGVQSITQRLHDSDSGNFNGSYVFGGGIGPVLNGSGAPTGQTAFLTPLEQYRRATLNLPGGMPTTFEQMAGTPLIKLTAEQLAFFAEDTFKLNSRLTFAAGLRYALQTLPGTYANFAPRLGLAWAVDKHAKTVVHLHAGLFSSVVPLSIMTEAERLDGIQRTDTLMYFPAYSSPLVPASGSIPVQQSRALPYSLHQTSAFQTAVGVEHELPHHWHAQANLYNAQAWDQIRSKNINAPQVAGNVALNLQPIVSSPRPISPGENIFAYVPDGHLHGSVLFLGLEQHSYKRFGFFLGYLHFNFQTDTSGNHGFVQSAYTDYGETAAPEWQVRNRLFLTGNVSLPRKVQLFLQMDAETGQPYNLTTGTDNNGDGVFNDRPSYAPALGPDTYLTRFGLLSANTINGTVPRNMGTLPASIHLDADLSRGWMIGRRESHTSRTLTLNVRSTNVLNHTNITAVNTVITSRPSRKPSPPSHLAALKSACVSPSKETIERTHHAYSSSTFPSRRNLRGSLRHRELAILSLGVRRRNGCWRALSLLDRTTVAMGRPGTSVFHHRCQPGRSRQTARLRHPDGQQRWQNCCSLHELGPAICF